MSTSMRNIMLGILKFNAIVMISMAGIISLHGQDTFIPSAITPSPNTEALFKFSDIPVDNFTGIPSINIPLMELQAIGFELPISLQYHASGIKLDEIGSPEGMGWSLVAGGAITRTVMDKPDERNNGFFTTCSDVNLLKEDPITSSNAHELRKYGSGGLFDGEPDVFRIAAPGLNEKFVFGCDGQPVFDEYSKIQVKIESFSTTANRDILSWSVIKSDGTKYLFSEVENVEIRTRQEYNQCTSGAINQGPSPSAEFYNSSWFLSKIITPRGDEIKFNYTDELLKSLSLSDEIVMNKHYVGFGDGTKKDCDGYFTFLETIYFTKRLNSIDILSSGNSVLFLANNLRRDLVDGTQYSSSLGQNSTDKIILKDKNQRVKKIFSLKYKYLTNNGQLSTPNEYCEECRLMLTAVVEDDDVNCTNCRSWRFDYFTKNGFPSRNSFAKDFLGFYNGKNSNNSLISDEYDSYQSTRFSACNNCFQQRLSNRNPDLEFAKTGMLKSVVYPTKGKSELEYEFSGTSNDKYRVLRILSISNKTSDNILINKKEFSYEGEYNSYLSPYTPIGGYTIVKPYNFICYFINVTTLNPQKIIFSDRHKVTYSKVKITTLDKYNIPMWYDFFEYSFAEDLKYDRVTTLGLIDNSWKRGWLTKSVTLDNFLDTVKVEKMVYKSSDDDIDLINLLSDKKVSGAFVYHLNLTSCGNHNDFEDKDYLISWDKYSLSSHYKYLSSKIETLYDQNSKISNITEFEYSLNHLNPIEITKYNSRNEKNITKIKYVSDYIYPVSSSDGAIASLIGLKERNMLDIPIETIELYNNKVINGEISTFKIVNSIVCRDQDFRLNVESPINNFVNSSIQNSEFIKDENYVLRNLFKKYGNYGLLLEYQSSDGINHSFTYDGGSNLSSHTLNAKYYEVLHDSFEFDGSWQSISGGFSYSETEKMTGRRSLLLSAPVSGTGSIKCSIFPGSVIVGKKYRLQALIKGNNAYFKIRQYCGAAAFIEYSSITQPSNSSDWIWYQWDFEFTSSCQSAFELFIENSYSGPGTDRAVLIDELRMYPIDSEMESYSNDQGYGISSITKSDCTDIVYYEYDPYGRLYQIKDNSGNVLQQYEYHYQD